MSIRNVETSDALPEGYRGLTVHGLPGHPKTAVGLKGQDIETGKIWNVGIYPDPANPSDSLMILIPNSVPFVQVVTADEWLEELSIESFDEVSA